MVGQCGGRRICFCLAASQGGIEGRENGEGRRRKASREDTTRAEAFVFANLGERDHVANRTLMGRLMGRVLKDLLLGLGLACALQTPTRAARSNDRAPQTVIVDAEPGLEPLPELRDSSAEAETEVLFGFHVSPLVTMGDLGPLLAISPFICIAPCLPHQIFPPFCHFDTIFVVS